MNTAWAGTVSWKWAGAGAALAGLTLPVLLLTGQSSPSEAAYWLAGLAAAAAGFAVVAAPRQRPMMDSADRADVPAHRPQHDRIRLLEGIIREIRQPMDSIQGFAEFLHSPAAANVQEAELNAYRQMLVENSRSLAAFLKQVKDFAQLEQGEARLIDCDADAAELAEAAVRLCREAAEQADVQLVADLEDGVELRCDVSRIRQSLVAMVRHAIRRTPRGGTVRIEMRVTAAGGLDILVADSGPPIAALEAERCFEPDLDRLGLESFALPVARRFLLLHSGDLAFRTLPEGAEARISLPSARVSRLSAIRVA